MSTTTYSVGHSVARRLRSILHVGLLPDWLLAVERLERGEGTEDDVRFLAHYCRVSGRTELAELLEAMLTPIGGER